MSSVLTWLCAMFFALTVSVSPGLCDSIAELRRKIQTVGADHVLFLDEVPFKLSEAPSHTVVLPGVRKVGIALTNRKTKMSSSCIATASE